MRQLERYVMVELLRVFGALITISTLLFVFVGVFGEAQKFDLGVWQILQIMPYLFPNLMPYTIPATLLLTVCVVYGRMAGDSEIIAVRAAGVHLMHLMWPSFFIAAVLSVTTLVLTDQVIPWAFSNIERIVALAMEDIFLDKLRTDNQINGKEYGVTITVTGVRNRTLIHPTIRYAARGPDGRLGKAVTIVAKKAHMEFDLRKQMVILNLEGLHGSFAGTNATIFSKSFRFPYTLPKRGGTAGSRVLRTKDLLLSLDSHEQRQANARQRQAVEAAFAMIRGDFESLQSPHMLQYGRDVDGSSNEIRGLRTEYFNRFAKSVTCFFVVLLGTPFSILMAKKQFLTTFLFCFLPILTVYYPIAMMSENLSKTGQLDPALSAWVANGALLIAAIYFIRRVLRN